MNHENEELTDTNHWWYPGYLGITRESCVAARNDYTIFFEEFTKLYIPDWVRDKFIEDLAAKPYDWAMEDFFDEHFEVYDDAPFWPEELPQEPEPLD